MDARDEHENTLLIAAILHADVLNDSHDYEQKVALVEKTVDCILGSIGYDWLSIDRRNVKWQTSLMVAAQKGYYTVAEYLYLHGANPRMKDIYGKTARGYATTDELCAALRGWEWEYLRIRRESKNIWFLLRRGMYRSALALDIPHLSEFESLSMRDKLGNSLIAGVIIFSFAIDQALSYPAKEELIIKLLDGIYELIPDPVAQNMLLDVQNKRGQTALMWAAKYGLDGVVEYLVHRGANLLLTDNEGRHASDYALL